MGSPALQVDSLLTELSGKPGIALKRIHISIHGMFFLFFLSFGLELKFSKFSESLEKPDPICLNKPSHRKS